MFETTVTRQHDNTTRPHDVVKFPIAWSRRCTITNRSWAGCGGPKGAAAFGANFGPLESQRSRFGFGLSIVFTLALRGPQLQADWASHGHSATSATECHRGHEGPRRPEERRKTFALSTSPRRATVGKTRSPPAWRQPSFARQGRSGIISSEFRGVTRSND